MAPASAYSCPPVVEEKADPVLLRRDRKRIRGVHDLKRGNAEFETEWRTRVGAHLAGDEQRGLLWNVVGESEVLGRHLFLEHHALHRAGAVAHLQEVQLAARAFVVQPPFEGDLLALVAGDVFDVDVRHGNLQPLRYCRSDAGIKEGVGLWGCGALRLWGSETPRLWGREGPGGCPIIVNLSASSSERAGRLRTF
jgi:hypothetical protein